MENNEEQQLKDELLKNVIELITILVVIPIIIFGGGWLVQFCWNKVIPQVFDLPMLTYAQGVWLNLLCGFLFGNGGNIGID